jgi:hypothetical protein
MTPAEVSQQVATWQEVNRQAEIEAMKVKMQVRQHY